LAGELGYEIARILVARLAGPTDKPDRVSAVLTLLAELKEVSPKAARAAIEALPELDRRAGLLEVTSWLDLGLALAESSGAVALKYFKESPITFGVIQPSYAQATVIAIGLELAGQDANVALEYLRIAPRIHSVVPPEQLRSWLEIGVEATHVDVVVGLEYIRQIPALVPVLPLDEIRRWLSFGMKLIVPNSLGKPDYMATMEFLRTSPAMLGDIEHPAARTKVVSLGTLLADHAAESGIACLAESPRLLRALPSTDWQVKVLQYGLLLGEKDAEATLCYLRRCPEIVGLLGDDPQAIGRFEAWFGAGMEVVAYSPEGARAYFAVESQKALASVEQALSGVPLRRVARKIKFFVQGLCGTDVAITALPDAASGSTARASVSADGRTISLPALLRRYPTAVENERLYLVMAAHEAGHLEFGTYRLKLAALADLVGIARQRYGRSKEVMPDSLAALFRLYPNPRLIQDLWTLLEDARVELLLQSEYPGLQRELAQLAAEAVTPRDPAHGLTVQELIVDCLLRLSTGESEGSAVPHSVKDEVSILWRMCQPVLRTTATAEETVRLAHDLYIRIEELLAPRAEMVKADRASDEPLERGAGHTGSEQVDEGYSPVTNWVYRGVMNPEFVKRDQELAEQAGEQQEEWDRLVDQGRGWKKRWRVGPDTRRGEQGSMSADVFDGGRSTPSIVGALLSREEEAQPPPEVTAQGERASRYPEWDHTIQDYRINGSRVVERAVEGGSAECVASTLTTQRSAIASLRRWFECLRPPAFRLLGGQADGEDLDIDAVVRRAADLRAGLEGGDNIYIKRDKRVRDVAVAFLADVSGSTSRQLENGCRVIDIEKESLALLCECLDAVGDQYGLYAYSGQGRASVDFFAIKDFDERLGVPTAHRLGGLAPRQQNRDGAAIRHASAKLMAREAKIRILILLSDGRPLDDDYKGEYALEDTKAALREARRKGIVPFCVTIDREADLYVRRMYGDVRFAVIDRVESLPSKLPRIYQKLTS
jgi:hypothetical protein